jgi:hypothetical protein
MCEINQAELDRQMVMVRLRHATAKSRKQPNALSHSEDSQRDLDVQYWVMALGSGGHGTASMRGFERSGA